MCEVKIKLSIIAQPLNWAPFSRMLLFEGISHYMVFSPSCSIEMSNAIPSPPFPLLRQAVKRLSLEYSQCSKPASSASHLPADDITAQTALCDQSYPACFAFGLYRFNWSLHDKCVIKEYCGVFFITTRCVLRMRKMHVMKYVDYGA